MQTITQYQAKDGRVFSDPDDCMKHERLGSLIEMAMSLLKPNPGTTAFTNGDGYVQQDPVMVEKVKNKLLDLHQGDVAIVERARKTTARNSFIARIWSDGNSPLYPAWSRLLCIDDHGREFGQPFFAANPDKAHLLEV